MFASRCFLRRAALLSLVFSALSRLGSSLLSADFHDFQPALVASVMLSGLFKRFELPPADPKKAKLTEPILESLMSFKVVVRPLAIGASDSCCDETGNCR